MLCGGEGREGQSGDGGRGGTQGHRGGKHTWTCTVQLYVYQLLQQYLYSKWWRAQRAEEKMVSLKVDTRK